VFNTQYLLNIYQFARTLDAARVADALAFAGM
jgi:hypothetical protein